MVTINDKKLCENCFCETTKEPCPECGFEKSTYVHDPRVLSVGSILENRYVVGGVIGKGGFGITYLAYDMKLECKVAIKEYYPFGLALRNIGSTLVTVSNMESEEVFKNGAEKFYNEARLVAKFNGNPNIVSVHDIFYENDTVYFTMGFLKGQTLKSYIKQHGVLSAEQAVCVANDISNALMAAHSLNVLHRDISPDNIMICSDGTIKLIDFGAARQLLAEGSQSLSVILKQGFAPLEQYQKKGKQGPWTDIYSLGATLYYGLTLEVLDDPMSRLEDDEEYSSNTHGIREELWEIIKKATMLKIPDRYPDIFEFKKALNAISIKPQPLEEPQLMQEHMPFAPLAKAYGNTLHSKEKTDTPEEAVATSFEETKLAQREAQPEVSLQEKEQPQPEAKKDIGVTMPLQEEKQEIGITMPLQEEKSDIGITTPLQEEKSDIGMTVPFQEESDIGRTMPLQENFPARKEAEKQDSPLQKFVAFWNKKRIGVAAIVAACVLVVIVVVTVVSNKGSDDTEEVAETAATTEAALETTEETDDTNYVNYVNRTVKYAMDYPEGYQVTEAEDGNQVVFTDGDNKDFQILAKYQYATAGESAIYSAKDFANQVTADQTVLTDWLGADVQLTEITNETETTVAGNDSYEYDFEAQVNGKANTGRLLLVDTNGAFGCYSILSLINEDAENADLYKLQRDAMVESFRLTDMYQAEGYSLRTLDDVGMKLLLQNEATTKTDGTRAVVYPVESVFVEANIWIDKSAFDSAKDINEALQKYSNNRYDHEDDAQYLTEPAVISYGRYSFVGRDMEWTEDGVKYSASLIVFEHNGEYWNITMKSTDEYYDVSAKTCSDILFSIMFDDEGNHEAAGNDEKPAQEASSGGSVKDMVSGIISDIQKQSNYEKSEWWDPLGVVDDFNGDGVKEFLTVHEAKNSEGQIEVIYELWSLPDTGAVQIKSESLFIEVGGNSGTVGIVKSGNTTYLAIERCEPEADVFNNYYTYFPWSETESKVTEDSVYLESHGTFGEEDQGQYILGDAKVDQSEYNSRYEELSSWVYQLDLFNGADGKGVMGYEDLLSSLK
jgi:serine/threonine protein kinase